MARKLSSGAPGAHIPSPDRDLQSLQSLPARELKMPHCAYYRKLQCACSWHPSPSSSTSTTLHGPLLLHTGCLPVSISTAIHSASDTRAQLAGRAASSPLPVRRCLQGAQLFPPTPAPHPVTCCSVCCQCLTEMRKPRCEEVSSGCTLAFYGGRGGARDGSHIQGRQVLH